MFALDNDPAIEREVKRDEAGRFITPPKSPGRPIGARNKLGEAFLDALQKDFDAHGVEAIIATRETKPDVYVRVIAGLLPTEHKLTVQDQFAEMNDDELADRIRQLAATIAPFLHAGTADAGHTDALASVTKLPADIH